MRPSPSFSAAIERAKNEARKRRDGSNDYYVRITLTQREHDSLHQHAAFMDCQVGDLVESAIRLFLQHRLGRSHEDMVRQLIRILERP